MSEYEVRYIPHITDEYEYDVRYPKHLLELLEEYTNPNMDESKIK